MSETKPTGKDGGGATRRLVTRRRLRHAALALAGTLTLLTFVVSSTVLAVLVYADVTRRTISAEELDPGALEEEPADPLEPINVLILGSDTRAVLSEEEQQAKGTPQDVEGERSDTMILARFDPQEEHAVLLHFPRDLLVEIPGHGQAKINEAFTLGGPNLALKTVRDLTGLPLHHYIQVDFNGFREIVDALGGVEICVDRPLVDELAELNLPEAGCYDMDGDTALAFVRARHIEGDWIPDFARISRQQQFIRAVMNEVFSPGTITKLPALIPRAVRAVTTDEGLTIDELVRYARELQGLAEQDPSGASTVDLRIVPSVPETIDGISYVVALPEAEELFRRMRQNRPLGDLGTAPATDVLPPSPAQITTRVLQAGAPRAAGEVERVLEDAGFIVLPRDVRPPRQRSEIVFAEGAEDRAGVVAGFFPDLPLRQGGARLLGDAEVVLVIGDDYEGPPT